MAWERRKPLSPFWNTCTIEARLHRQVVRRPMPTRNGEPSYWTWLQFRAIYRHQNSRHPHRDWNPGVPIWGKKILMKVYAFGKTGVILSTFNEGDWVRFEGYLTGNRFSNNAPVICLLAKRVTLLARRWQSGQHGGEKLNRHLLGDKTLRQEEHERLLAKGLIKPSLGDLAAIPDDPPEVDSDSLDFDI